MYQALTGFSKKEARKQIAGDTEIFLWANDIEKVPYKEKAKKKPKSLTRDPKQVEFEKCLVGLEMKAV